MEHNQEHTIALLARTPGVLDALLRNLPNMWTLRNEGQATWSAFDVVGHLIDGERVNWMPRARILLADGETRMFEAFDRHGHARESQGKTLEQLLDEFAELRRDNLKELHGWNLRPDDFTRKGSHPAFGVVTLSQLLATWAAHDLTHLNQITRVMAHQYREAVGPWSEYLGVLRRSGQKAD
jgi:hypothetical protein